MTDAIKRLKHNRDPYPQEKGKPAKRVNRESGDLAVPDSNTGTNVDKSTRRNKEQTIEYFDEANLGTYSGDNIFEDLDENTEEAE